MRPRPTPSPDPPPAPAGRIASVNVGRPRTVQWRGRSVTTSIWKEPVDGRVAVRGVNVAGDDQADRKVHGGPDKAVYAYAAEDLDWWAAQLDRAAPPGLMGENLTTRGVEVTGAVIGEVWRVGSAHLEVAQPRFPCHKLGIRMGDAGFPGRFEAALRPGAYLRILREGHLAAGDAVEVLTRPEHGVTIGEVARIILQDRAGAARLLDAPQLPRRYHEWAARNQQP